MTASETVLAFIIILMVLCAYVAIMQKRKEYRRQRDRLQLAELRGLTPEAFEAYVARLFKRRGYAVVNVRDVQDHGVDIVARNKGRTIVIQCKRYGEGKAVGEPAIRDLLGTVLHEGADTGILVTTGRFTAEARLWAAQHRQTITLIDGEHLVKLAA